MEGPCPVLHEGQLERLGMNYRADRLATFDPGPCGRPVFRICHPGRPCLGCVRTCRRLQEENTRQVTMCATMK